MSGYVDINTSTSRSIWLLALANFALGTETYVYAGHLAALARDTHVSVAEAGQLASVFAITYALSAPVTAALIARFERRGVLVAGLLCLGMLNLLAVLASSLPELLALRIACGLAAGMVGPIASAAAAELAPPERRGRALAIVLAGMTAAFVLGIPMGSVVGDIFGWRGTFGWAAAIALLAALALRLGLPKIAGSIGSRPPFRSVLTSPVAGWLTLTAIGFAATFTVIAYVGPVVGAIAGLSGSGVGAMQALIGVGSILGIWLGGRAADSRDRSRPLVLSLCVSALALGGYGVLLTGAVPPTIAILPLGLCMIAGAAALFSRTPVIQAALVELADDARPIVLGLNGSAVFVGQSIGAALGGVAIATSGMPALGLIAALLALAAIPLALRLSLGPAVRGTTAPEGSG